MSVEEFDVITILGRSINIPIYKVKHKETQQTFIWHTVEWKNDNDLELLEKKLRKRIQMQHTHLMTFYDLIKQSQSNIGYVMTEFCENSDLRTIVESCKQSGTYLCEELICKIIYQIALILKTTNSPIESFTLDRIFLDSNFTVKLYNFTLESDPQKLTISCLGRILYHLCTLCPFDDNYKKEFHNIRSVYSGSLLCLLLHMINSSEDLKEAVNELLCHPTLLLKNSHWNNDKCFLKATTLSLKDAELEVNLLTVNMGKLKSRELALRAREQKLDEWEDKLKRKQKELAVLERKTCEKLQQAELYLKRIQKAGVKKSKSTESEHLEIEQQVESGEDKLNATYATCGDPVILTSKKLNANEIIKPASFTRNLSERRIRFKGHSPLKEIDFNRRRSIRSAKQKDIKRPNSWVTCSEETESADGTMKLSRAKQLFPNWDYENFNKIVTATDSTIKPVIWTKENKKQAFNLLRLMNTGNRENEGIKHTFL